MNIHNKEKYEFYRLCNMDFDDALLGLKLLENYNSPNIRNTILRDVTITYIRPFAGSKCRTVKERKLKINLVPVIYRDLHKELLDLRNQLFAHTDLQYRNPNVMNWSTKRQKWFPMSFKGYDYSTLNNKVNEIAKMVQEVKKKLSQVIEEMEERNVIVSYRF